MRRTHRLATLATIAAGFVLAACVGWRGSRDGGTDGRRAAATHDWLHARRCADLTQEDATTVEAGVSDNTWSQPVEASVGDVITWTNDDRVPHRVALDDASCSMSANISGGGSRSLAFSVAGTYPFHCAVHGSMKGVITIK